MNRAHLCLILGLALTTVSLPASAWHSDLPVVERISVPDEGAWSITLELEEAGSFAIELEGNTSDDATRAALGAASLSPDGEPQGSATLFLLTSADGVVAHKRVDHGLGTAPEEISFQETGQSNTEGNFWGVAARKSDQAPGTFRYGFWMGGMQTVNLTLRADTAVDYEIAEGTPHMNGAVDFDGGQTSLQAQAGPPEPDDTELPNPGVRVMRNASLDVTVEHQAIGSWIALEPASACQAIIAGTCVPVHALADALASDAEDACEQRTNAGCHAPRQAIEDETETRISWAGPDGADGEGSLWYDFDGAEPGTYRFTVDEATEAYTGTLVYDAETGTYVALQPTYFLLVLADLPDPPTL